MVELTTHLDYIFGSLADATRRDILRQVIKKDLTISQIAKPYAMSFAAVAKHIAVLNKAKLITKSRQGKEQLISANLKTIQVAAGQIGDYESLWRERYNKLEDILKVK